MPQDRRHHTLRITEPNAVRLALLLKRHPDSMNSAINIILALGTQMLLDEWHAVTTRRARQRAIATLTYNANALKFKRTLLPTNTRS